MNRSDQRRIIEEMCRGLRAYMLENLHKAPAEWDGHELRHWLADTAREKYAYSNMSRARKREYNNTRLVGNL
jgi:hypothetical protein